MRSKTGLIKILNAIISFLIFFTSCNLPLLNGPLSKIKSYLNKKYDITPSSIIEQDLEGKYKHFGIGFYHYKPMEKKEAMAFVSAIYSDLIEKANQYLSLQNEFVEQPIPKKCLHVEVIFLDKEYNYYPPPSISCCEIYEKYFLIDICIIHDGKEKYITEKIYYEYD